MACRLAICPTRRSPVLVNATTDGVRRLPSALGMTCGWRIGAAAGVAVGSEPLDRGLPRRRRAPPRAAGEEVRKQLVHRLAQRREVVKRIPPDAAHGTRLLRTVRSNTHDTASFDPRSSIRS